MSSALAAEPQPEPAAIELEPVEVIGVAPTHGVGLPLADFPAHAQRATDAEIARTGALDLTDFLDRRIGSVHLNTPGGNPLQPELGYRGFKASPLLGLPQGLAVYQDGVRINEPFGDVVNWDLVPLMAVADLEVVPGSNPVFGLNTLGGALSLRTKTGFSHPAESLELGAGAFGRRWLQAQSGGHTEDWSYYAGVRHFEEDGWRDHSRSEADQAYASLGWVGQDSSLDLGLTLADTDLRGNGAVPVQLLAQDREAVFTYPDATANGLRMLTLDGSHYWSGALVGDATLYYRYNKTETFNGDDSDFEACDDEPDALCADDGEGAAVRDQFGEPVDVSANPRLADLEAVDSALNNYTTTRQRGYGGSAQLTWLEPLLGRDNQLTVGMSLDAARIDFDAASELARLTAERGTVGSGLYSQEAYTGLEVAVRHLGIYASNTWYPSEALSLTLAGRYNRSHVELEDQRGTALNGDHRFERFNPSLGAAYRLRPRLTAFASYSESSRAPTPVELTCADENDPCRLPNGFQADPPLDQAVARTWEAGLRGGAEALRWSAALFRTEVEDTIYFISAGPYTNAGFFDNIGDTRRQGLELALEGGWGEVEWFANYTYLAASFRDSYTLSSPNHPAAGADGQIPVEAGDELPLTPDHLLGLGADWRLTPRFSLGADLVYRGAQYLRGDEGNLAPQIDAYTVVDARAAYRLSPHWQAFVEVENLFGTEYETFGTFGEADEVLGEAYDDPRFLTPGAPRGGWIGVRARF